MTSICRSRQSRYLATQSEGSPVATTLTGRRWHSRRLPRSRSQQRSRRSQEASIANVPAAVGPFPTLHEIGRCDQTSLAAETSHEKRRYGNLSDIRVSHRRAFAGRQFAAMLEGLRPAFVANPRPSCAREKQTARLWEKQCDLQQRSAEPNGPPRFLPILAPSGGGRRSLQPARSSCRGWWRKRSSGGRAALPTRRL